VAVSGADVVPAGATDKITSSFAHRVDAACAANLEAYPPVGQFPYASFNPQHPLPSQLPVVGAYFAQNQRSIRPLESAFTRLGDPPHGKAAWHRVRALAFDTLENAKAQKNAALAGEVHRFVATVDKGSRLVNRLKSAASQAGLSLTGACSKIFQ
jgi:hypothetical protein